MGQMLLSQIEVEVEWKIEDRVYIFKLFGENKLTTVNSFI